MLLRGTESERRRQQSLAYLQLLASHHEFLRTGIVPGKLQCGDANDMLRCSVIEMSRNRPERCIHAMHLPIPPSKVCEALLESHGRSEGQQLKSACIQMPYLAQLL